MKKYLTTSLIILALLASAGIAYSYYNSHKSPVMDTSKLDSVSVNGVDRKTTGAIPSEDVTSHKILEETVLLRSSGTITTSNFQILVVGQGQVTVKLFVPYPQNKQKALDYLKANGYGDIPETSIDFQEVK